jgi:D-glycero-alpha-D-manno-heptose-7-phosphate kinase
VLVTSRTPLRVSLFGGGTDYRDWFMRRPGAVLGFTIDKYIYISALKLSSFVDYRYRLTYSKLELEQRIEDIQHPVVRAVLMSQDYRDPLDCSIQADLPANIGLGSSSAFAVGFLRLVSELQGVPRTKHELAQLAIDVEQNMLSERVGVQDQLHATFGGINRFDLDGEKVRIHPMPVTGADMDSLADWMLLVYTRVQRHASATVAEQIDKTASGEIDEQLAAMLELVDEAQEMFESKHGDDLACSLAGLLDRSWQLKRTLSSRVTNSDIDDLYDQCRTLGALGGKLCGAGGGGFLLVVVPPDRRADFVQQLGADRCVPFRIEHTGSSVVRNY